MTFSLNPLFNTLKFAMRQKKMVNVSSNTINENQNRIANNAISLVNSFECLFKMCFHFRLDWFAIGLKKAMGCSKIGRLFGYVRMMYIEREW